MTLTLSLTLTCDLCSRDTIIVPALGCTSTIAVIASRRPFRHSDITPLKVDGLVDGGWVTRTRRRKMVDLCGECASKPIVTRRGEKGPPVARGNQ